MRRFISLLLLAGVLFGVTSCSSGGNKTAILWTDRPEFAFYAEFFNASQDEYKVETHYYEFPAQELADSEIIPDIVAGSWLKSASTRVFFRPLDRFFKNEVLFASDFYPRLLSMGNIEEKQYLLPVSFNAPMVIFARDYSENLSNPFTIGFDEMRELGKKYNVETNGIYSRMGFSPSWDANFLFIIATLYNASFREAEPLAWDSLALDRAMRFAYEWIGDANTSIQAVEDFTFKYFYTPPAKLTLSGRILFTSMRSDDFFVLAEDQQGDLDFRWLAEQNTIPLAEESVYLGLSKEGKAPKAAGAFIQWFFNAETQRSLLEFSRQNRMFETSFGIGGGFSAMRTVTEQIFPRFYRGLLGHMPPEAFLSPANILPGNWIDLKERVILPYLRDRARQKGLDGLPLLERRIANWQQTNR